MDSLGHTVELLNLPQRNILINERGACLTDFGLAAFVESDTSVKTSTRSGSTCWMAPELLLPSVYKPELPFRRTPASDVWAFGCVCCEVRSFALSNIIPIITRRSGLKATYHSRICRMEALSSPSLILTLPTERFHIKRNHAIKQGLQCRRDYGSWSSSASNSTLLNGLPCMLLQISSPG